MKFNKESMVVRIFALAMAAALAVGVIAAAVYYIVV